MLLAHSILLAAISYVECAPSSQIISGEVAQKGEFPYLLSLQYLENDATGWRHICGATLINPDFSITAATCFLNSNDPSRYRVVAGLHEIAGTPEQQILTVLDVDIHEGFQNARPTGYPNNIALIRHQNATTSQYVRVIALPTTASYATQLCNITGWGRYEDGETAPVLRRAGDTVITFENCDGIFSDITLNYDFHLCLGTGQIRACGADIGGPMICPEPQGTPTVAGLNSFNEIDCSAANTSARPSVYTRVYTYLAWICARVRYC